MMTVSTPLLPRLSMPSTPQPSPRAGPTKSTPDLRPYYGLGFCAACVRDPAGDKFAAVFYRTPNRKT
jgi:hypothetical protein